MESIKLKTERLLLKPLSIDELYDINSNNINAINTYIDPESLSEDVFSAIKKKTAKMEYIDSELHTMYTYWLIIDNESGKGIGFIGFKGINEEGSAEVGYSISPAYRRKGLMTEALKAFINWAHANKNLNLVTANVKKSNIGSIKVLQNCGFKLSGSSELENFYCLLLI